MTLTQIYAIPSRFSKTEASANLRLVLMRVPPLTAAVAPCCCDSSDRTTVTTSILHFLDFLQNAALLDRVRPLEIQQQSTSEDGAAGGAVVVDAAAAGG